MTELTNLANSIAASKENIRQALVARGVDCAASVPLADYAGKINNMVISGEVDNISAVNQTGAAITTGDKVFVKKNAAIGGSKKEIGNNVITGLINPAGTKVYYVGHIYDIASTVISTTTFDVDWRKQNQPVRYDSQGNLLVGTYLLKEAVIDLGKTINQENYATESLYAGSTNRTTIAAYKINSDYETIKTFTVSESSGGNIGYYPIVTVIGNKMYVSGKSSPNTNVVYSSHFVGTIDDTADTITLSSRTDNYVVEYTTGDNAIAICTTSICTDSECKGFKFICVDSNYNLGEQFLTNNSDLAQLQGLTVNIIFNRNTGILCVGGIEADNYYGIFKYENGDFTTVAINLTDFTAKQEDKIVSICNDFSKLQIGRYMYTLQQTSDDGYKAINYQPQMGSDVLSGFALNDAEIGASFNVKTILPED